jgi:hypothetical protein
VSSDDDNLHLPPGYPTGISSDERAKQQLKAAADSKKTKEEKAEEANKEPLPSELPLQLRVTQFSNTILEMLILLWFQLVVGEDSMPNENNSTIKKSTGSTNQYTINPKNGYPYNMIHDYSKYTSNH